MAIKAEVAYNFHAAIFD